MPVGILVTIARRDYILVRMGKVVFRWELFFPADHEVASEWPTIRATRKNRHRKSIELLLMPTAFFQKVEHSFLRVDWNRPPSLFVLVVKQGGDTWGPCIGGVYKYVSTNPSLRSNNRRSLVALPVYSDNAGMLQQLKTWVDFTPVKNHLADLLGFAKTIDPTKGSPQHFFVHMWKSLVELFPIKELYFFETGLTLKLVESATDIKRLLIKARIQVSILPDHLHFLATKDTRQLRIKLNGSVHRPHISFRTPLGTDTCRRTSRGSRRYMLCFNAGNTVPG